MQLADALITELRDLGIAQVFGVSGANIEHVHDAIHRLGQGKLRSVLTRSEIGASFMADAHARVHSTLGVCCATSGGGMMNLAVGIAEAHAESVPVLAIVGQPPMRLEGRGAFQDSSGIGRTVNALQLWGAITKRCERVEAGEGFWELLHGCLSEALSGRPGPVALLIPRDVYALEVPERPEWMPRNLAEYRQVVEPDASAVEALQALLDRAERPVLLLGTGVRRSPDAMAVVRFALESGARVASTMGDVGAFVSEAPGYLGMVGVAGHPSAHQFINDEADLVVAIGTGLDVMVRSPILEGLQRAKLAVVNVDAGSLERALEPDLVVSGDAGRVCGQLRGRRATLEAMPVRCFVPTLAAGPHGGSLLQSEALQCLQEALPERGHLLFDAGNCAAAALHYLKVPAGVSTTIALGMGGMGYAIPGGVGAQLGSDGGRTVVLCGDGAFLMQGFEVHTAVELGLDVLFVVFNNNQHGMCVTRQQLFFEGRLEATQYPRLSFATVAQGLGPMWTAAVDSVEGLKRALADYEARGGVGVLELVLRQEELPPFAPFLGADAATMEQGR